MTFTQKQLLAFDPCRDGLNFAESCGFDFAKIYDTCERGDWLIWLLRKMKAIDKMQAVLLACDFAERVLAKFEKKHPKDKRPRQAIESARNWAKNPTKENQESCRAAADAAYAAYAAADAAAAAADAAAADAADAGAAAAGASEHKWQADKVRELIPNPFK